MSGSRLELNVMLNAVDKITRPFKAAQAATNKLAAKVKQSNIELKQLNDQAAKIEGFRKLKTELLAVGQKLEQAKSHSNALNRQFKDQSPTAAQAKQLKAAANEAKRLSEQFKRLQVSVQGQRNELNQSGISTRNLSQHQQRLRSSINTTNQSLERQRADLARVTDQQKRLNVVRSNHQNSMQNRAMIAGNGYAALATGRQIGRWGVKSLQVGYEFDALMSQTQAVTRIQDKDDPKMAALRNQARTLPLSSKFTDSEVAAGQFYLARTGYNADQVLDAMPSVLSLATAGDLDLGVTADIASNIQTAMRIPAKEMDHVADVLTALFTRNNVDIEMLGESLKYSAGVGQQFGQSLETVAASTAILGSSGIQGSMAGTTMRSVLTRIGNSSAVEKLGVKTTDKNGDMRDLVEILKDIDAKTAKMGNVQRAAIYEKIAGKNAVSGFSVLMDSVGNGTLEKMRGQKGEYKGEAVRVAKTMMDNLKGDMTILHAGLENISVELFEKNNEWLRKTAKLFSDILHSVAEFLKQNPKFSKGIVIVGASLAAITTIVGGLMIAIVGLLAPLAMLKLTFAVLGIKGFSAFGLLTKGFKMLGGALLWVGRAAMANPVIAIITLIAMGAYLIYKNWDWLKAKFAYLMQNFVPILKKTLNNAKAFYTGIFKDILSYFENLPIVVKMKQKWQEITNVFSDLKDDFLNAGQSIIDWILDGIDAKWQELKEKFKSITDLFPDVNKLLGLSVASVPVADVVKDTANTINTARAVGSYIVDNASEQWQKRGLSDKFSELTNYIPVQQSTNNSITDNSKTEFNITVNGDDGDIMSKIKRAIFDAQKDKETRQRGLLADIN